MIVLNYYHGDNNKKKLNRLRPVIKLYGPCHVHEVRYRYRQHDTNKSV